MDDDDDDNKGKNKKKPTEFECPECNANNPVSDGFEEGSEVQCFYCGVEFKVTIASGRYKFRPL